MKTPLKTNFFFPHPLPLLLFVILIQNSATAFPKAPDIKIDKIDAQKIYFSHLTELDKQIPPLHTNLFNIEPISLISAKNQPSENFFIFIKANPCDQCEDQRNFYLIRSDSKKFTKFTYPGTIKDSKSKVTLHVSRAYFGECLKENEWSFVAFQDDRSFKRRRMQNSVFVAKIEEDGNIKEELITARRSRPSENTIKSKVKKGHCQSITAWNRSSISFQLKRN